MAAFPEALDRVLCTLVCPRCGAGALRRHDTRPRGVWDGGDVRPTIPVLRVRCPDCRATHTVLPDFLTPYRRYPTPLREAVLNGTETAPPCDARTTRRWAQDFYAMIVHITVWLVADLHAKLATTPSFSSSLTECHPTVDLPSIGRLRQICQQHGHSPPATGLLGWVNIHCASAATPLWV